MQINESPISTQDVEEEIEGVGDNQPGSWGEYPIDTLLIRTEQRTVHDVTRRIEQGRFIMDPDFQRDFIWAEDKQSKLIESVMMRIPLPVFYLAENDDGNLVVVDGLQRLSTFQRFLKDDLTLRLKDRSELDGKKFSKLPNSLQNRVEDCNLILYVIDPKAPDQVRLDIFERVNGGIPLTRQQMRNCLYMGKATRFLKEQSKTKLFLDTTGHSLRTATMRDREFLNRFCAFTVLGLKKYRDMDDFLADALREMNTNPEWIPKLEQSLENALQNNLNLFSKHAFRKHRPGQGYRNVINASLWDVMSTGLCKYSPQELEGRSSEVVMGFHKLMDDDDFIYSITYATNSVKQVNKRFEMAEEMFRDLKY